MTDAHIDQLAQWYADAEQITKTNLPRKGDTLIYPHHPSGYVIESDGGGWAPELVHSTGEAVRILARAPKPKPAWHNAEVVTAVTKKHPEFRDVWVSDCGEWRNVDGDFIEADELIDPTPLIEAKVTREQAVTALDLYYEYESGDANWPEDTIGQMGDAISAALVAGLTAEGLL